MLFQAEAKKLADNVRMPVLEEDERLFLEYIILWVMESSATGIRSRVGSAEVVTRTPILYLEMYFLQKK